jgi:glycosyltransferase involved in cell wall biosynthesis
MTKPTVSVLVPNYNKARFLKERFDSILQQSLGDLEVIVLDGYSTDGSWDIICKYARSDCRIRHFQGERNGIYNAINDCIKKASGKYLYIATSDDNMAPDCLATLARDLDQITEADIATCPLRMFDAAGIEIDNWWLRTSIFAQSAGKFIDSHHLRFAPFDGLLHLFGASVYVSLTQLLIRREVFQTIGLFRIDSGSIADFEWNMRATLRHNVIFNPKTWAGWRVYENQATASVKITSWQHRGNIERLVDFALQPISSDDPFQTNCEQFPEGWRYSILDAWLKSRPQEPRRGSISRLIGIARRWQECPNLFWRQSLQRITGRPMMGPIGITDLLAIANSVNGKPSLTNIPINDSSI